MSARRPSKSSAKAPDGTPRSRSNSRGRGSKRTDANKVKKRKHSKGSNGEKKRITVGSLAPGARPQSYHDKEIFKSTISLDPRYRTRGPEDFTDNNKKKTKLYRGIPGQALRSIEDFSYLSSMPGKYSALGSGIYTTPDKDTAQTYATKQAGGLGCVLAFNGLGDAESLRSRFVDRSVGFYSTRSNTRPLNVVEYRSTDSDWQQIVAAHIKANRTGVLDFSRVSSDGLTAFKNADVLIGPVVGNWKECLEKNQQPVPDDDILEYVFRDVPQLLKDSFDEIVFYERRSQS